MLSVASDQLPWVLGSREIQAPRVWKPCEHGSRVKRVCAAESLGHQFLFLRRLDPEKIAHSLFRSRVGERLFVVPARVADEELTAAIERRIILEADKKNAVM